MRQLVQNTNSLSIGKLSQNQIKIGSGSGSNIGIYFNNGKANMPGIRFLNSDEDEYIFHFDTSTGIFNSQSWPQGEEAIFYFKKYDSSTNRSGWIATSSTGVSLGLTGILNQESQWIIVRAYDIEDPEVGPIVIAVTATLPNLVSWGSYGNVCTLEYIPPVKEWQYSKDGSNWFSIKPGESSIDLSYELISITSSDLVDGVATIKHNLGQKYVLGLDYTVTPDNIEYTDENTLTLDYSKHIGEVEETSESDLIISGAGTESINQKYIFTTEGTYYDMAGSSKNCADTPNGGVWFSEDNNFVLFARTVSSGFEYDIVDNNNYTKTPYYVSSQPYITDSSKMPWDVEWMKSAKGAEPVPTFNKQTAEVEISKIWFIESKQDMLQ